MKPFVGSALAFKKSLNSGTSWKRYLRARKLPSSAHAGRVIGTSGAVLENLATISPSRPHRMAPCLTVS